MAEQSETPEEILGVPRGASEEEISKAFRQRAKGTHPDVAGSTGEFQKLNAAKQALLERTSSVPAWRDELDLSKERPTDILAIPKQDVPLIYALVNAHKGNATQTLEVKDLDKPSETLYRVHKNGEAVSIDRNIGNITNPDGNVEYYKPDGTKGSFPTKDGFVDESEYAKLRQRLGPGDRRLPFGNPQYLGALRNYAREAATGSVRQSTIEQTGMVAKVYSQRNWHENTGVVRGSSYADGVVYLQPKYQRDIVPKLNDSARYVKRTK